MFAAGAATDLAIAQRVAGGGYRSAIAGGRSVSGMATAAGFAATQRAAGPLPVAVGALLRVAACPRRPPPS